MAIYIVITKCSEGPDGVFYSYVVPSREGEGEVVIPSGTSDVRLLRSLPGEDDNRFFMRVRRKLQQHLATGSLPQRTCWAS